MRKRGITALRTRDELLKLADEYIMSARTCDISCSGYPAEAPENASLATWCNAYANLAQACVALAKEMREAKQVVTCANADAMTQILSLIQQTLAAK